MKPYAVQGTNRRLRWPQWLEFGVESNWERCDLELLMISDYFYLNEV